MSYDPSLGTWMEEDPDHYIDGANMFDFEENNPVDSEDPTGTTALTIDSGPFIPKSHGYNEGFGVNYGWEPFGLFEDTWQNPFSWGSKGYVFGTDDREKCGEKGSSRYTIDISLDGVNVGNLNSSNTTITVKGGTSREALVPWLPNGEPNMPLAQTNIKSTPVTPKVVTQTITNDPNGQWSEIHVHVKANDPNCTNSPNLNTDFTYRLDRISIPMIGNFIIVTLSGSSNSYPNNETDVDGSMLYGYTTPDTVPSPWNLGDWAGTETVPKGTSTLVPE